jgi:hypothetical protein
MPAVPTIEHLLKCVGDDALAAQSKYDAQFESRRTQLDQRICFDAVVEKVFLNYYYYFLIFWLLGFCRQCRIARQYAIDSCCQFHVHRWSQFDKSLPILIFYGSSK